jgi:hypothetical protein
LRKAGFVSTVSLRALKRGVSVVPSLLQWGTKPQRAFPTCRRSSAFEKMNLIRSVGREVVPRQQRAEVYLEVLLKKAPVVVQRVATAHATILGTLAGNGNGRTTKKNKKEHARNKL